MLHGACQARYDLVEPGIDDVVAVGSITDCSGSLDMSGELIDDRVKEGNTDGNGARIFGDRLSALLANRLLG